MESAKSKVRKGTYKRMHIQRVMSMTFNYHSFANAPFKKKIFRLVFLSSDLSALSFIKKVGYYESKFVRDNIVVILQV